MRLLAQGRCFALLVFLAACRSRSHASAGDGAISSASEPNASSPASVDDSVTPTVDRARIASRAMETYVFEQPSTTSRKLGYLRAGAIVESTGPAQRKKDCPGGFVPIVPLGYVCIGPTATAKLDDPVVAASQRRPELSAGLPYGYGVVRNAGAPFYTRLPKLAEEKLLEPDWDYHFRTLAGAEADEAREGGYPQLSSVPGGAFPLEPAPGVLASWASDGKDDPIPPFVASGATLPNLSGLVTAQRPAFEGSTTCDPKDRGCIPLDAARPKKRLGISFVATFEQDRRRWLLTTDLLLMPADRVRLVRGTSFHGVELGEKSPEHLKLPIVMVRREGATRYRFDGHRMKAGEPIAWRSALAAASKQRIVGGTRYHELQDGTYASDEDVVRLDPIRKLPKWGKEGERWIDINLAKQTLLAVDGAEPVYATFVSTGAGGLASPKDNPYVTPRGIFRVHTKHVAATMDSNQPEAEFELRDVPYIQYFKDGYALHAAYWHDQFGQPRSHGCVNLAPIDARWLFAFTKPELPANWHGVMKALTGTIVWIHT